MSWKNRLENIEFTIKTGDGKVFKPLWKNGEKSKEFNTSKYDFINVQGSFVDRKKASANQYPLVFWFQGDDNIEQCNDFELSANDSRYWVVEHPFYGTIKGQPTNIKRVDNNYNVTEVSVDFWESLTDEVSNKVNNVNNVAIQFAVENSEPKSSDVNNIQDATPQISSKFEPDAEDFNDYRAAVNKSISSTSNLILEPLNAFKDFQEIINIPAGFIKPINETIESYINAFEVLFNNTDSLFSKYFFESNGASILSAMCLASINAPSDNYVTRNDIEKVSNNINSLYDIYLKKLDSNQVSIYDINNSWFANTIIQNELSDLITFTSNSLFLLGLNAKQERSIELLKDSNLIVLAHRFVGLDSDDKNIERFRQINNIKNNELYKIKKGRTIKYFV